MTRSIARSRAWPSAAALAALLAGGSGPALAGDGSATDNPDLLRGAYTIVCADSEPCPTQHHLWSSSDAEPVSLAGSATTVARETMSGAQTIADPLPPPATPQNPVPIAMDPIPTGSITSPGTPGDDAVLADWQIALRGSSTWDGRGQRYAIILSPEGSLAFQRARGELRLAAGLDLAYEPGGSIALDGANGTLAIDHALQRDLLVRAAVTLDGAREQVNAVTSPAGEQTGALSVLGNADLEIEKQFGRAAVALGGSLSRRYVGDTTLVGGTLSSNADRSWTGFGLRARASYKLTPIISPYVEIMADRAYYDAVSAGTGVVSDNWSYQATAGLAGVWSTGMTAELYGGYGLVQYDSAALTSGGYFVLGGSFSTPFARGGTLTASASTTVSPTDSVAGASTEVDYGAALDARYLVNDWLAVRAALGGSWTLYPGADRSEYGVSANAGFDWLLGPHTSLTSDYTFGADWTPTTSGTSHEVSIGMVVHR